MFGRAFESRLLFSRNVKQPSARSGLQLAPNSGGGGSGDNADTDDRKAGDTLLLQQHGRVPSGLLAVGRGASKRALQQHDQSTTATRLSTTVPPPSIPPNQAQQQDVNAMLQYEIEVPRSQPLSVNLAAFNTLAENSIKFAYRMRVREHVKVMRQEAHIMSFVK